jgi:alkanesulfonate monooxygenase SsuD/methylene tetrahydromethanopterin reductase-like flavin-dependent oxidoreductase (luciferase family)
MKVGISLTSNHPDAKDPRQGARWMIERAAAAHNAGLDSLFVGDQHVSPTPYYQNTPMLGRLLAEWGKAPAGCLFDRSPTTTASACGIKRRVSAARRPFRACSVT